jgi:membrane protein CcdC involved in cytochrome C biogenesis
MIGLFIAFIGIILIGGLFIGLQVLVSIKGPKFAGLILPAIHILVSGVIIYLLPLYTYIKARNIGILLLGAVFLIYLVIFFVGLTVKNKDTNNRI